jgi:uncharacterized protein (DUF2147 family)
MEQLITFAAIQELKFMCFTANTIFTNSVCLHAVLHASSSAKAAHSSSTDIYSNISEVQKDASKQLIGQR